MSRLTENEKAELQHQVSAALRKARQWRYPVLLVIGSWRHMDESFWKKFAELAGLAFVDMIEAAQRPDFQEAARVWPTAVDWLRGQAAAAGGIVAYDVDAIVTKWGNEARERFFARLLRSETRLPGSAEAAVIVVPTVLAGAFGWRREERERGIILHLGALE
ncbi:MAG: hypothetical protein H5T86_06905 [Armatimonadetes bacterium]|nr:hypothetical protein [Armatimonadota bacterium]